jgi:hypothetical protein
MERNMGRNSSVVGSPDGGKVVTAGAAQLAAVAPEISVRRPMATFLPPMVAAASFAVVASWTEVTTPVTDSPFSAV